MKRRFRLLDAVIVAAAGLLGLRLVAIIAPESTAGQPAAKPVASASSGQQIPAFGRVIANARSNGPVVADPEFTGSVGAGKGAEQKGDQAGSQAGRREAQAGAAQPASGTRINLENPQATVSPAERALLERLGERRDELDSRSRELETREKLLESAEKKLETRINELKTLEDRGSDAVQRKEEGAALRNLVTMYEAMKPKEAARVFDRLPHDVLVPVVLQMNPRKMAEVLASMTPEAAERLTVALASRAKGVNAEAKPAAVSSVLPPTELPAIEPTVRRELPQQP
ncbi:hypothetical protein QNA08_09390 [Chelatococcus sp. SYSU_G07232]|uniref:Flagellar motility protein MotE, a chaperone for MotC folding n=1 Tax=Chelatococcus albus TaxID=3047466 RepID=A0ABT7AGG4_9HYPH|nr:hypothetical protein [Chelatococcus sp. SYSU_G07232]MDJ1158446.1 hypothetical protein [Chelatococcus sp. SYSU_G07232]